MKGNSFLYFMVLLLSAWGWCAGDTIYKNEKSITTLQQQQQSHDAQHEKERERILDRLKYNDCHACHDQQDGCYRDDNNDLWCSKERR